MAVTQVFVPETTQKVTSKGLEFTEVSEIAAAHFHRVAEAIHQTLPLFHLKKDVRRMLEKKLGLASGGYLQEIKEITEQFGPAYCQHSHPSVEFGDKGTQDQMLTWIIVYLNGVPDEEREDWAKGRAGTKVQQILGKLAKDNYLQYLPVVCMERIAIELNLRQKSCGVAARRNSNFKRHLWNSGVAISTS